jgi:hypothetical protein
MLHNKMSSPNTPPAPLLQTPLVIMPPFLTCPCCAKSHDPEGFQDKAKQGDLTKDLEKLKRNAGGG